MDRRDFIKSGALVAAGGLVKTPQGMAQMSRPERIAVRTQAPSTPKVRLAVRELMAGLRSLDSASEIVESDGENSETGIVLLLSIDRPAFRCDQEYEISASRGGATLRAASEQALLYAVFDFLERQGLVFGIDGTTVPIDRAAFLLPSSWRTMDGVAAFCRERAVAMARFSELHQRVQPRGLPGLLRFHAAHALQYVWNACLYAEHPGASRRVLFVI